MGGKALLIVIVGLSATFLIMSRSFTGTANSAVDNIVYYADKTVNHNAAVSGANLGCSALYVDENWTAGYSNLLFEGSRITVTVTTLNSFKRIKLVKSIAIRDTIKDTVLVVLQPSKFSKYAYYSNYESSGGNYIYWATGDTVFGPMHSQDYIRVNGRPVFMGKVSTKQSRYIKQNSTDKPQFLGGFDTGYDLPLPATAIGDLETFGTTGGKLFTGKDTVFIEFASDTIRYKYQYNATWTNALASTFTSNGVIFAKNAVVRLSGIVEGQFTLAASGSTGGKGSIYLDDNIVYKTNPQTNVNATDILGIVAENDVIITKNPANNSSININASIFCYKGGFTAQEYNTRPYSGSINLYGGVIQTYRKPVGSIGSNGSISNGFNKSYKYDKRFAFTSPPNYPTTGSYEIISWYE